MNVPSEEELDREQMEVHANMLEAFDNAQKTFTKIADSIVLINFNKHDQIQKFYDSLCYYADAINSLKLGFHAFAGSHEIELIDPVN